MLLIHVLIAQTFSFAWEITRTQNAVICTAYKQPLNTCVDLEFSRVHVKEDSDLFVKVFSDADYNLARARLQRLDTNNEDTIVLNSTSEGGLVGSLFGIEAGRYKLTLEDNPAGLLFTIDPKESWTFSTINTVKSFAIWPFIVGFGSALVLALIVTVYRNRGIKDEGPKQGSQEWVPLDTVEWE